VRAHAERLAHHPEISFMRAAKLETRARDEKMKPLEQYRDEELKEMRKNFFGEDKAYHVARQAFVRKACVTETPRRFAIHRR
jgi:putative two-component system hydrogenase maturation factor HypX/HoxX